MTLISSLLSVCALGKYVERDTQLLSARSRDGRLELRPADALMGSRAQQITISQVTNNCLQKLLPASLAKTQRAGLQLLQPGQMYDSLGDKADGVTQNINSVESNSQKDNNNS